MKFAQIAIGTIILIEAVLLLYSPQQRHNFHSFAAFVKSQFEQCGCLKSLCYMCIQKLRFFVVAVMMSGAFSLTLGNNIIVGILAQLLWTVTQSQLFYGHGINDIKNTLIQVLFLVVLLGEFMSEWKSCIKKRQSIRRSQSAEQKKDQEALGKPVNKDESKRSVRSQQKPKQKEESKKTK